MDVYSSFSLANVCTFCILIHRSACFIVCGLKSWASDNHCTIHSIAYRTSQVKTTCVYSLTCYTHGSVIDSMSTLLLLKRSFTFFFFFSFFFAPCVYHIQIHIHVNSHRLKHSIFRHYMWAFALQLNKLLWNYIFQLIELWMAYWSLRALFLCHIFKCTKSSTKNIYEKSEKRRVIGIL